MSGTPDHSHGIASERALKFAVQHIRGDRVQVIEGTMEPLSLTWDHERVARLVRRQLDDRVDELGCVEGSGKLDHDQTLLVVEVTSESNAEPTGS